MPNQNLPPKISIITASLNQGRFIEENIKSILDQEYPNFEHIVVDGGSTDNTVSVLQRYPHLNWTSEPDAGQSDAINKGFLRSSGKIILWLNSDDFLLPGAMLLASQLLGPSGKDIITGHGHMIREDGSLYADVHTIFIDHQHLLRYWQKQLVICQPSTFMRREVIEQIGLLDTSLNYTMDYDFFLRASLRYHFFNTGKYLSLYTLHETSKSGSEGSGWSKFTPEIKQVQKRYWGPTNSFVYLQNYLRNQSDLYFDRFRLEKRVLPKLGHFVLFVLLYPTNLFTPEFYPLDDSWQALKKKLKKILE